MNKIDFHLHIHLKAIVKHFGSGFEFIKNIATSNNKEKHQNKIQ